MTARIDTTNGDPFDQHVHEDAPASGDPVEWISAWADRIKAAIGDGFALLDVNTLCTTWPVSAAPGTRTLCTNRSGLSDQDFLDAHASEVVDDMATNLPTP